ncbi:MAG: ABC transporter permease, partial [Dehalococcoidia bacterium]
VSLYFSGAEGIFRPVTEPILLDNFRVMEDGVTESVESFEAPDLRWGRWASVSRIADGLEIVPVAAGPDGDRALRYTTAAGRSPSKRGIYFRSVGLPIAAVASSSFAATSGATPGTLVDVVIGQQVVPVVITGVTDLFPTLTPAGRGFLLMDTGALFGWGRVTGDDPIAPNEIWVDVAPEDSVAVRTAMRTELRAANIVDRSELIREQTSNPIISAGASGLLGFGFVAAFSVLCLAVVLTLVLDAEQRSVSTSVLRAVGLSTRSVFGALAIEYSVVVALGVTLGIALGLQVGAVMLRFLEVTERGEPVLPPFVLQTNYGILGFAVGLLLVVMVGSVLAAGFYLRQVSVARAIRLSE